MKHVSKIKIFFIFALLVVLIGSFPLIGKDMFWANIDFKNINFINFAGLGIINSSILLIVTKCKIVKILIQSLIIIALFVLMKSIVNKKNFCLLPISVFLFFLVDRFFFCTMFISSSGFCTHILGSLFTIIYIYLFGQNKIETINWLILFLFGSISCMINPLYSVLAFTVTSIYLIKSIREKEETSKLWCLATGQLLGLILIVPNMNTIYPDFSHNLLEEFIPKMVETNFFMTLITSALILFCSVKVFMSKNSFLTILSITGISSYLFSSLLTDSIYLNYVTFICHFLSEYFILKNLGTSRIFKRNIDIFFTFKALFIILLAIFGGITYESTVLLYVIDILIILEIYDHVFPTEFLGNIWYLAMVMSIISNIYIYNIVSTKYDEMNMYIKNRLECTTEDINLPSKYKTEYLYDYLPNDKDKLKIYTEYYEIDIYSDTKRNIRFRE